MASSGPDEPAIISGIWAVKFSGTLSYGCGRPQRGFGVLRTWPHREGSLSMEMDCLGAGVALVNDVQADVRGSVAFSGSK